MKALANRIERELQIGKWKHCAVYENELQRLWPLEEIDREAKIGEFAKRFGFRLRFYHKGLCAIFDKWPRGEFTQPRSIRLEHIKLRDLEPLKHVTGGGAGKRQSKRSTSWQRGHDVGAS